MVDAGGTVPGRGKGRTCKPGFVPHRQRRRGDDHFSRTPVARRLWQPTRGCGRNGPFRGDLAADSPLLGLAPDGVYRAEPVTRSAGELLPHRFTLTGGFPCRRSVFCGTFPDLTAGGRYPPSRPAEPGLSSRQGVPTRRLSRVPSGLSRPAAIRSAPFPLPGTVAPNHTTPAREGFFDQPAAGA